ncbi:hypothetical protein W97_09027 [Coniosporium apollinis CBS 100218]|uniref:Uncharacterized protein n=1 Tax=Coniosporium apollinis (strain CBS 100218) TaxID=1168221 RepID=R7Z6X5_CONA1|nr:uncharacterized protein W97_09027 [Coniosporium apollinis CBS 100218]EON69764.1 hypothetical protein W97_09027 [Coniosporium apollinis CBS 100218]
MPEPSLHRLRLLDIKHFHFHALASLQGQDANPEKILEYELRRENYEKRLQVMERLCEHLAPLMRREAAKLLSLPLVLRNMIYEHLYVEDRPIEVSSLFTSTPCCRQGPRHGFLPVDSVGLMSSYHVGQGMAEEAARVFYNLNAFHIEYLEDLPEFLSTDQYGIGMLLRDHVRKLLLVHIPWHDSSSDFRFVTPRTSSTRLSDREFEDKYEDWLLCTRKLWDAKKIPDSVWRLDSRYLLEPLLRMPQLRVLEMDAVKTRAEWDPREIPFELRNKTKIKVQQFKDYLEACETCGVGGEYYQLEDISDLFNGPTDDERLAVKENVDNASDSVRRDAGWIRVKLYDHFELYKSRKGL